jgi:hypothetical protein
LLHDLQGTVFIPRDKFDALMFVKDGVLRNSQYNHFKNSIVRVRSGIKIITTTQQRKAQQHRHLQHRWYMLQTPTKPWNNGKVKKNQHTKYLQNPL